jgi:subtilisin family serine protease
LNDRGFGGPDRFGGYPTDCIHVRFDPGVVPTTTDQGAVKTGVPEIDALNQAWSVTGLEPYLSEAPRNRAVASRLGLDRSWKLRVPKGTDTPAMAAAYDAAPGVDFAELDGIGGVAIIPNDTYFENQYHLHNTGQSGGKSDADIDAPEAWELWTGAGGEDVVLAIIDTGIAKNHDDLKAKLVQGRNVYNNSDDTDDKYGHGTHVAGIAGAISDNERGVAGVSWGVKLMPVKCLSDSGYGSESNCADAIIWATDHGAHIASMSLQFYSGTQGLEDAVEYGWENGVLLVAANGNNRGRVVAYPAKFPHCMAISATDDRDAFASFSNYGPETDVAAPGDTVYSTQKPNTYAYLSGTSMATPCVAGLGGLLKSYNPELSNDEIEQIIEDSAEDRGSDGWDEKFGWGRINAHTALQRTTPPCQSVCGDSNCDGSVTFEDIDCFVAALTGLSDWEACGTACDKRSYLCTNDLNRDGGVDFGDIDPFVTALVNGVCE